MSSRAPTANARMKQRGIRIPQRMTVSLKRATCRPARAAHAPAARSGETRRQSSGTAISAKNGTAHHEASGRFASVGDMDM